MRKDNSVALNYEENPLNIAYGWRGKMKIVRYLASLTVDIDLKANIGKK